jgi:hypothetical protein
MKLYTAVSGQLWHYTLEDVAQFCQVTMRGRHTAYGDAMATAAILQALAPRLSRVDQPVSRLITCQRVEALFCQI